MDVILKQIALFPRLIDDEVNRDLYRAISKEKIKVVISNFRKDKSPGSDDGIVEFYDVFFYP